MLTLPGQTIVEKDLEDLFSELGSALCAAAAQALEQRGVFHLALSGGSTPEPFYHRLVTDPLYRTFPWAHTHLWVVDERHVPADHEKSNWRMLNESLVAHVPIPESNAHRVPTEQADAAGEYEGLIAETFGLPRAGAEVPRMDFILLGMGGDAHTASLFPQSPAQAESKRWYVGNDGPRVVPPARLTMTYPLLNHGRRVAVLATGKGKAETLARIARRMAEAGPDVAELPITGVDPGPQGGRLTWFLDVAAAEQLRG